MPRFVCSLGRFRDTYAAMAGELAERGMVVDTGHWQSIADTPQSITRELRGVTLEYDMPVTPDDVAMDVQPNLPWADLHFAERVGGEPTNPGDTYHLWPYFRGNVPKHQDPTDGDKFSHTYMERFWPRRATGGRFGADHHGIRYRYGDLMDVVALLCSYPYTRQAYLPVWFPEDTGAHAGERVPCTLGYHFMLRAGALHVMYPIRSCDFLRHFRDDVYLAVRLVQWVIAECEKANPEMWSGVTPGELKMDMHSLHVFEPELPILRRHAGLTMQDDDFVGGAV